MIKSIYSKVNLKIIYLSFSFGLLFWLLHGHGLSVGHEESAGRSVLRWISMQWLADNGDFAHFWIMPLVSLYFVWRRRFAMLSAPKKEDWRGLVLMAVGLLALWLTIRAQQPRVTLLVATSFLWLIPFTIFGFQFARQLIFPVAYLALGIGSFYIVVVTFRLRVLASAVSAVLLNGIGIATERTGTALYSEAGGGFQFDVADPCSGLRSLVVITALCAPYAMLALHVSWKRWLLFVFSVPFAMIANVSRILILAILAVVINQELALKLYHNFAGYMVFGIAVVLVAVTARILGRIPSGRKVVQVSQEKPPGAQNAGYGSNRGWPGMVLIAMLLVTLAVLRSDVPTQVAESHPYALPEEMAGYQADALLFCQNEQCQYGFLYKPEVEVHACPKCGETILLPYSLAERIQLPDDVEIQKRLYQRAGQGFQVSIVRSGGSRSGIHRPEGCLVGQGFQIFDQHIETVDTASGDSLDVMVIKARHTSGRILYLVYWFRSGKLLTPSNSVRIILTAWDGIRFNKRRSWSYVSVTMDVGFAQDTDRHKEMLRQFVHDLYISLRESTVNL